MTCQHIIFMRHPKGLCAFSYRLFAMRSGSNTNQLHRFEGPTFIASNYMFHLADTYESCATFRWWGAYICARNESIPFWHHFTTSALCKQQPCVTCCRAAILYKHVHDTLYVLQIGTHDLHRISSTSFAVAHAQQTGECSCIRKHHNWTSRIEIHQKCTAVRAGFCERSEQTSIAVECVPRYRNIKNGDIYNMKHINATGALSQKT